MANVISWVAELDDRVSAKSKKMFDNVSKESKAVGRDFKDLSGSVGGMFGQAGQSIDAAAGFLSKFGIIGGTAIVGVGAAIGTMAAAWATFGASAMNQNKELADTVDEIKMRWSVLTAWIAEKLTPVFKLFADAILFWMPKVEHEVDRTTDAYKRQSTEIEKNKEVAVNAAASSLILEKHKTGDIIGEAKIRQQQELDILKLKQDEELKQVDASKVNFTKRRQLNELKIMKNKHATETWDLEQQTKTKTIEAAKKVAEEKAKIQKQSDDDYEKIAAANNARRILAADKNIKILLDERKTKSFLVKEEEAEDAAKEKSAEDADKQQDDRDSKANDATIESERNTTKQKLEAQKNYQTQMAQAHEDSMDRIRQNAAGVQAIGSVFGAVSSLMDVYNKKSRAQRMAMRALLISQTIMNTAAGIMNIWATPQPPWISLAQGVMVGLTGAAQVAKISQQKFEKGGIIRGNRHMNGGVQIEAEDGESILNRHATRMLGESGINRLNAGGTAGNITIQGSQFIIQNGMSAQDVDILFRHSNEDMLRQLDRNMRENAYRGRN